MIDKKKFFDGLDRTYEFTKLAGADGRMHFYDLPVIIGAPRISKRERREIYERGNPGLEFHGASANTILRVIDEDFTGTGIWVPHTCRDFMDFDKFESQLEGQVLNSFRHEGVLIKSCWNESVLSGDLGYNREIAENGFPWVDFRILSGNFVLNISPEKVRKHYESKYVKPRLTIIRNDEKKLLTPNYKKNCVNKLWAYMKWVSDARDKEEK